MAKRKKTLPIEEWITAAQAGKMLGISRAHIHRLIQSGEFEARFVVGRWLVNPQSVKGWTRKRAPNKQKDKPIE